MSDIVSPGNDRSTPRPSGGGLRPPRQVLVVGPDPEWRRDIRESLASSSLSIEMAETSAQALALAEKNPPDLILLDMLLPDTTGLGLCRLIREHADLGPAPIIVVSRHASEVDRVLAFELGADDFLPAPFFARELVSRTQAVLRRSARQERRAPVSARPVEHDGLELDLEARRARFAGAPLDLTRTEFEILRLLIREEGRVLSRRQILGRLQGDDVSQASERTVDAHVKALRRKLREARSAIETVRGVGYRFAAAGAGGVPEGDG